MMKFSVRNREVIKVFACVLFMFVILWCSINMRIIFGSVKVSPDNITSIMRDKYQNCIQILGIIVPIVYSLAFYKIFALGEKHIIIRYGKRRYEKIESKNIFIFSFIFAVEYIGAISCCAGATSLCWVLARIPSFQSSILSSFI